MMPAYCYSKSSPTPIDLNEDHNPQFFIHHQPYSPSSSLSYPTFYNPDQDEPGSLYWESKPSQTDEEAEKPIPLGGSWAHPTEKVERNMKLTVWREEEKDEENQNEHNGPAKWMSSKMRIMQKMMASDQTGSSNVAGSCTKKHEDQKQPLSPHGTDKSSTSCSYNSSITARVCSDCHTTKTPLWRSGPRGPKSLCNACGIRQRKARRAMAAAAATAANGTILAPEAAPLAVKKLQKKEKKSKINGCSPRSTKRGKLGSSKPISQERENFGFEDFRISLSKKLAVQKVFPQDEKEAAILLMALSYGLVHG